MGCYKHLRSDDSYKEGSESVNYKYMMVFTTLGKQ